MDKPTGAPAASQQRGQPPRRIRLPEPALGRLGSVARAFALRRTTRDIGARALPRQTLSNLLWAACGINRRQGPFGIPGRTDASASNSQEVDVYVALKRATYRYDPALHELLHVEDGDLRELAISRGQRPLGSRAPVRLIFVANLGRLEHTAGFDEPGLRDPDVQKSYYFVDTGLIAGNVYLYAASSGLAAWFHNCDRSRLHRRLHLDHQQRVLFAQTVGYALTQQPVTAQSVVPRGRARHRAQAPAPVRGPRPIRT